MLPYASHQAILDLLKKDPVTTSSTETPQLTMRRIIKEYPWNEIFQLLITWQPSTPEGEQKKNKDLSNLLFHFTKCAEEQVKKIIDEYLDDDVRKEEIKKLVSANQFVNWQYELDFNFIFRRVKKKILLGSVARSLLT